MAAEPLTEFHAVIEGNPGDASVNGWKVPVTRVARGGGRSETTMIEGTDYRRWKRRAAKVFRKLAAGRSFAAGPLHVAVVSYWDRKHRQGPADGLPMGDADAVVKAVLDALEAAPDTSKMKPRRRAEVEAEHAGVFGDDAQVVKVAAVKGYDKKRPRIEVKVVRAP